MSNDQQGDFEFIATFQEGQQLPQRHEKRHCVKEDDTWFYVDGDTSINNHTVTLNHHTKPSH